MWPMRSSPGLSVRGGRGGIMDRGRGRGRGAYHSVGPSFSRSSLFPEEEGGRTMGRVRDGSFALFCELRCFNSYYASGRTLVGEERHGSRRVGVWPALDQSQEGIQLARTRYQHRELATSALRRRHAAGAVAQRFPWSEGAHEMGAVDELAGGGLKPGRVPRLQRTWLRERRRWQSLDEPPPVGRA